MSTIPTAEEYALENMQSADMNEIERALIGFARLHVDEFRKELLSNVKTIEYSLDNHDYDCIQKVYVDNCYPLELIK